MARKANGYVPTEFPSLSNRVSLSAVQELLGAIATLGADVHRIDLNGQQVFLVAVRQEQVIPTESPEPNRGLLQATSQESAAAADASPTSLDAIFDATCRRLQVARRDLVSNRKGKIVRVARMLVAQQAKAAHVSSIKQVGAITGLKKNSASLYVGISRLLKRRIPEFTMPLAQFLRADEGISPQLQKYLGKSSPRPRTAQSASDAEIGSRLSRALPAETA